MQMLVVYAKDLKEGFAEYAPSITKIMVPHLKFFFHELVRAAAAEILPHLLECVRSKGERSKVERSFGTVKTKGERSFGVHKVKGLLGFIR